jgi:DNA excision repair protein ERCC-6
VVERGAGQSLGAQRAREEGLGDAEHDEPLELEGGFSLDARVNRRLYWYQRTGVRWLWELYRQGAGGILGDEMGLGKSVQLAAFLGGLHRSGRLRSALVVAPATLMAQWASELFSWAPRLRVVILHRSGQAFAAQPRHKVGKFIRRAVGLGGVVALTTYEGLKLYREQLLPHVWDYVALDEGQKIRNPDAEVTVCSKQLATVHRVILSGTPIQNNLKELWSLFDFVFPGRLGTLPTFEAELATPIRMGGYSNATPSQAQLAYRCALVLRDLINPYLLRRMKKDIMSILPMPPKTEQVLFCRLTGRQKALYRAAVASPEIRLILDGKASHFRAITILRKICNHPDLAAPPDSDGRDMMQGTLGYHKDDEEDEDEEALLEAEEAGDEEAVARARARAADYGAVHRSCKMQVLEEVLPRWEAQGHRVLLFSQTRMMLDVLEGMVRRKGWAYLRMDGNTGVGSRPALIERFNTDPSIFVFLLTTRTGGLGINLTGADRVVLYDPDWNPQTDVQARERAWRLGQKRPVTIYRLVTSGTIEEKIYQRQIYKVRWQARRD